MSLQEITNKIKAEAEAQVKTIWAEADERLSVITKETESAIEKMQKEAKTALDKEKAQQEAVAISLEKQRASLAKQAVKRELLDEVYEQAFAKLVSMPSEEYVVFLENKVKELVPKDSEITSIISPVDRKTETEAMAKSFGWSVSVTTDEELKGGCVLIGKDFEFDLSLKRLFTQDRLESEMTIANALFSANK